MKAKRLSTKRMPRTRRAIALPESILRLFPKTSRMGQFEGPAQWGRGDLVRSDKPRKARVEAFHL
jgi:hypothetical protein